MSLILNCKQIELVVVFTLFSFSLLTLCCWRQTKLKKMASKIVEETLPVEVEKQKSEQVRWWEITFIINIYIYIFFKGQFRKFLFFRDKIEASSIESETVKDWSKRNSSWSEEESLHDQSSSDDEFVEVCSTLWVFKKNVHFNFNSVTVVTVLPNIV